MAEILALVGSIIAVVQVANRVTTLGNEFLGRVKGASREVMEMIATVSALKPILELLPRFVQVDRSFAAIQIALPTRWTAKGMWATSRRN